MSAFLLKLWFLLLSVVPGLLAYPTSDTSVAIPTRMLASAEESSQREQLVSPPTVAKQDEVPKVCTAKTLGNPCPQGGVATLGAPTPVMDQGVGNPVDLRSGNKYQRETDLPARVDSLGLELVRHYNAMDPRQGPLGRGWSTSYDTRIYQVADGVQIVQADGSRLSYGCSLRSCVSAQPLRGTIYRKINGWSWLWPTGRTLTFNAQGRLISLQEETGKKLNIQRHDLESLWSGLIHEVSEQHASSGPTTFKFIYSSQQGKPRLSMIQTPSGSFEYFYDVPEMPAQESRLIRVKRPDGMERQYHYEKKWQSGNLDALTGISIHAPEHQQTFRTHSWQYNNEGRAIQFAAGSLHDETMRLDLMRISRGTELSIDRSASDGSIVMRGNIAGWPSLNMQFDQAGDLRAWFARGIGIERWEKKGNTQSRIFADQTRWDWHFDHHGRLLAKHAYSKEAKAEYTRIGWRGVKPVIIAHDEETQVWRYGRQSIRPDLVREREVFRPARDDRQAWSYRERFEYNRAGQRIKHVLPEGGALHYRWEQTRLLSIIWEDKEGVRHPVISHAEVGILHGNGLLTAGIQGEKGLQQLMVYQPMTRSLLQRTQLEYNSAGGISRERNQQVTQHETLDYRYDAQQRLSGYQSQRFSADQKGFSAHAHTSVEYAWRAGGDAAMKRSWPGQMKPDLLRDESGLPRQVGEQQLRYNAQRRLSQVKHRTQGLVNYAHNAFGEQIWRNDGDMRMHFLYDQNKLVAQAHQTDQGVEISKRYVYAHQVPVAVIENGQVLYMIHADPVGLPRLITDRRQQVRWSGHYSPLGALLHQEGDLSMSLRLPGQVADPATGWHDNYQRTYDPKWGHYLEPDPLGPAPDNSMYGYAGQQPRRHIDPLGLLLVAFDGTNNSANSETNVWMFAQSYRDGPVLYKEGPGGDMAMSSKDWAADVSLAYSGSLRVNQQWERMLNVIANSSAANQTLSLDLVGFSRGAALARHFGNRVVQHVKNGKFSFQHPLHGEVSTCMDLRFMGLFDTVAQFNVLGSGNFAFDLTVSPVWKWVSHAVALHEHRWYFPLTSARGPSNLVERAFVGAHADIGGGYLSESASPGSKPGNLSNVSLAWMQWQARAAGLQLGPSPTPQDVDQPFMHDERAVFTRSAINGDRSVHHASDQKWVQYQADLPGMGKAVRQEVEAFIHRLAPVPEAKDAVGWVDMLAYRRWLEKSMGFNW